MELEGPESPFPEGGCGGEESSGTAVAPPFHIANLLSESQSRPAKKNVVKAPAQPAPSTSWAGHGGSCETDWAWSNPHCSAAGGCKMCGSSPLPPPPSVPVYPPPFLYSPPSVLHLFPAARPPISHNLPPPPTPASRFRTTYTATQLRALEDVFSEKRYVNIEDRLRISRLVGVTERQVKMWFQNRRTKLKKERSLLKRDDVLTCTQ